VSGKKWKSSLRALMCPAPCRVRSRCACFGFYRRAFTTLPSTAESSERKGTVGEAGEVQLVVRDSGKGFDLEAALRGTGLGLTSMQEQVRYHPCPDSMADRRIAETSSGLILSGTARRDVALPSHQSEIYQDDPQKLHGLG